MRLAVAAASRLRMRAAARRWHTAIERTNQQVTSANQHIRCPPTAAADRTAIECALPWRQHAATACAPQLADGTAIERTNQQAASHISCPLTAAADCTAIEWRLAMPAASRYRMRAGNRMRLTALPADCR